MAIEGMSRIIAAMSCGVVVHDAEGVITLANQAAAVALGLTTDQLFGRSSLDPGWRVIHEDGSPFPGKTHPSMTTLASGKAQYGVVMGVSRPNGELRWLSVSSEPIFKEDGGTTLDGVVVTFIDITAQQRARQALRDSDHSFKQLFDHLDDVFYQTDAKGRFTLVSPSAYEVSGYRPEELYGTLVADLYVEADGREKFLAALQAAGGSIKGYEVELRRKDGTTVWVSTNVHNRYDSKGESCGLEGSVRDITSAKMVAQAHRDSEALFRAFFQHTPLGVVLATGDGDIFRINKSMERMFGYSEEEFRALRFSDYAIEQIPLNMLLFSELVEGRRDSYLMEKRFRRKDGSTFWGNYCVTAIRGQQGTIKSVFTTIEDISGRIEAEHQQKRLQHQLQQAQKMEAIGQLTGGIAHDFNNILGSILGYAELALEHFVSPEQEKLKRALEEIVRGGRRAEQLIAQMLDFSRGRTLDSEPLQVGLVIDEIVKLVTAALPATIQLERLREGTLPRVMANPVQLHQTLLNLVINARDALAGKGRITLSSSHGRREGICTSCHNHFAGEFVEIEVRDSAGRLPHDVLEHIFEPFFTTKPVGRGTGMGLAMVHGIMHEWDGHIRVAVEPDRSTTFHLYLPVLSEEAMPAGAVQGSTLPAKRDRKEDGKQVFHIMLVDDEVSLGHFVEEILKIHGYRVSYFSDSRAALEQLSSYPAEFDLLLTDQTMPHMSGIELAGEAHALRPELPVVICSGYSDEVNEYNAADYGINSFLTKPIDTGKLLDTLEQLLALEMARQGSVA